MNKADIRQNIIKKLKNVSETERNRVDAKLFEELISSSYWKNAKRIGVTVSNGFEWNTKPIIEEGWKQGKAMCVPKCYPTLKELKFFELEKFDQLEIVYYNLQEPKPSETIEVKKNEMDLIIVPGIVFDRRGYRIGFGGGYYDRFLANYKKHTVSILHSLQLMDEIPVDEHDIAINTLITEKGFVDL
ncbi:5-formyltetrahydrofolate cyclo-ligase [Oceanobacillus piezotolerans]|uniref:5-formyltetrahydrofolate cyclo-ligase n=1 Tax=Oceanobacillus piezotolerans TaxID=2448030 RepID=A0A498DD52_9BACI|nr:5-formyltetrahydrofolate cyclo-ligase [Oceanobacillus piezotolerans]RLL44904.1 5-formyltetrahydrofolate cyclo-ligase [Oceanobacillus piezotolerans]